MEGVGRWTVHVDGGREEVGARRGAVEGWPGCMGEGWGILGCVRDSNHSCLYLLATLKKLINSDRGCTKKH